MKLGDIEYFELLGLRDKLKFNRYDRLGLEYLDRLRAEIDRKIAAIHYQAELSKKEETQNKEA